MCLAMVYVLLRGPLLRGSLKHHIDIVDACAQNQISNVNGRGSHPAAVACEAQMGSMGPWGVSQKFRLREFSVADSLSLRIDRATSKRQRDAAVLRTDSSQANTFGSKFLGSLCFGGVHPFNIRSRSSRTRKQAGRECVKRAYDKGG